MENEKDPVWGTLSLVLFFLPGIFWSLLGHIPAKKESQSLQQQAEIHLFLHSSSSALPGHRPLPVDDDQPDLLLQQPLDDLDQQGGHNGGILQRPLPVPPPALRLLCQSRQVPLLLPVRRLFQIPSLPSLVED